MSSSGKLPELVLITYYGRSGSYLLHALLDGAETTISLPCEVYFLWSLLKSSLHLDENEFERHMYEEIFVFYFEEKENQDLLLTGSVKEDFQRFLTCYRHNLPRYSSDYALVVARFVAIHIAFHESRGGIYDGQKIIYQLHVPCAGVLLEIMDFFPGTKHLQMLREPLATMCALIKAHALALPNIQDFFYCAHDILFGGFDISKNGGTTKGLKLEALHAEPENCMRKVASYLDVPWNNCLLKETMLGRNWGSAKGFTQGFDLAATLRNNQIHKNVITEFDEIRLLSLMYSRYRAWDYEVTTGCQIEYEKMGDLLPYEFSFENFPANSNVNDVTQGTRKVCKERIAKARLPIDNFKLHYLARKNIPQFQLVELL